MYPLDTSTFRLIVKLPSAPADCLHFCWQVLLRLMKCVRPCNVGKGSQKADRGTCAASDSQSICRCQLHNAGFLETSDSQSIYRCQLSNAGFLEASDVQSIHRCQLSNAGFLKTSDSRSIHRCQLSNAGFLEASNLQSIRRCQLHNAGFLETSDLQSIHRCQLSNAGFLYIRFAAHPLLPTQYRRAPTNIRIAEHPWPQAFYLASRNLRKCRRQTSGILDTGLASKT